MNADRSRKHDCIRPWIQADSGRVQTHQAQPSHFRVLSLNIPHPASNCNADTPKPALMSSEHEHTPDVTLSVVQQHKTESPTAHDVEGDSPLAPAQPIVPVANGVDNETANSSGSASTPAAGVGRVSGVNGVVVNGTGAGVQHAEPPPPYSEEPRRSRRQTIRSIASESDDEGDEDVSDSTPLLNGRTRRRAAS